MPHRKSEVGGTMYFDNFESRRFSYIGPLPPPDLALAQPSTPGGYVASAYAYSSSQTVGNYTYHQPHAATSLTPTGGTANTYTYDTNGNMTCRLENGVTYKQTFNSENRLSTVQILGSGTCASPGTIPSQWDFKYDGDGNRVQQIFTDFTASPAHVTVSSYFMRGLYEQTDKGTVTSGIITITSTSNKKYYSIAGMTVALYDSTDSINPIKYMITDHLGSVIATTTASGTLISQQRYMPFGQVRTITGGPITQTDFGFTGQRNNSYINLLDYRSRWMDPLLGRFVSADSIVPSYANPQSLNRYSYGLNKPIIEIDP